MKTFRIVRNFEFVKDLARGQANGNIVAITADIDTYAKLKRGNIL